jgi:hypothetical protein
LNSVGEEVIEIKGLSGGRSATPALLPKAEFVLMHVPLAALEELDQEGDVCLIRAGLPLQYMPSRDFRNSDHFSNIRNQFLIVLGRAKGRKPPSMILFMQLPITIRTRGNAGNTAFQLHLSHAPK